MKSILFTIPILFLIPAILAFAPVKKTNSSVRPCTGPDCITLKDSQR